MILDEDGIPSIAFSHRSLPLVDDGLEILQPPIPHRETIMARNGVYIDDIEDEDHVQFFFLTANRLQDLIFLPDPWHLAHGQSVILAEHFAVHLFQKLMHSWPVCEIFEARLPFLIGKDHLGVGEALDLGDDIDHIHPVTAYTPGQPKAHDIMDRRSHLRVFPVKVGLLWREEREIILSRLLVKGPGAVFRAEKLTPIVGWLGLSQIIILGFLPDIPVTLRIIQR